MQQDKKEGNIMCGRYSFDDTHEIFEARALLDEIAGNFGEPAAASVKRGEVFPTDKAAILAQTKTGRSARVMSWGFPLYDPKRIVINARSETLFEKPMFKKSVFDKRCLVPCTGFYEWQTIDNSKQKYQINIKDENFFYMAGLYNSFKIEGQDSLRFVIITAPANDEMKQIHHRMPLIVPMSSTADWLEREPIDIDYIYNMVKELDKVAV